MLLPGTATSGLRSPSPIELKSVISKPYSVASTEATAIDERLDAGAVRPTPPSLPAAVMTTMPASQARSTASSSIRSVAGSVVGALKASARTLMSYRSALATTQSMPLMRSSGITEPSRPATLTDTMPASGASPLIPFAGSSAATIPARCVP